MAVDGNGNAGVLEYGMVGLDRWAQVVEGPLRLHQSSNDLGKYIIPSSSDTSRPAVPNYFLEGKSAKGRADVAVLQACYDGAVRARAMHQLQNYC
jgi:hypothetical protein